MRACLASRGSWFALFLHAPPITIAYNSRASLGYEERLVQTVRLDISANQGPGYRTYSRQTISAERAGNWRVELRSQDVKGYFTKSASPSVVD